MKKPILFFLLVFLWGIGKGQSPSPIGKDANLVLYAGYFAKRQNTNNNGYWLGSYADIPLVKSYTGQWNMSAWANYAHSYWTDNMAQYDSKTDDLSIGLGTGYYGENFSYTHSFYGGLAIGYKHSQEEGGMDSRKYKSFSIQRDDMLSTSLNLNLIKYSGFRPYFLPRTQLIINGQIPLLSHKKLSENNGHWKEVKPWNKGMCEITLKESIADIPLGYDYASFLQPKVGLHYSHYSAGDPNVYAFSLEFSFHRAGKDDFLSISWMQKFHPDKDIGIIMMHLNVLKLNNKY